MKKIEEIMIWWEGSFTYDEIINNKIDNKNYFNKATDIGLYAVYGHHILYGDDVLLYIGITTEQDFKTRLKYRGIIEDNSDSKGIKIYLGRIYNPNKIVSKEEEIKSIKKAEALLIYVLKPVLNTSFKNSVNFKKISDRKDFIIFNHNSYRDIPPEVSTLRWWGFKYLNYDLTDEIANELHIKASIEKDENGEEIFYGFTLKTNDNICLGVDQDYWDKTNIPLAIGIYEKELEDEHKKTELKKHFTNLEKSGDYYFIPACQNLKSENVLEEIKNNLNLVESILK